MGKLVLKYESSCINCGKENTMVDYNKCCADCQSCDGNCWSCADSKCDNHPENNNQCNVYDARDCYKCDQLLNCDYIADETLQAFINDDKNYR